MSKQWLEDTVAEMAQSRFPQMEVTGPGMKYAKSRRSVETILNDMVDRNRKEKFCFPPLEPKNTRKRRRGPKVIVYRL